MTTATGTALAIKGDRRALARALGAVAEIVPSKGTVPIHSTIRVDASDGKVVRLTGTNGAIWVEATVDALEVESPGLLHLDGQRLASLARDMAEIEGDHPATIEEGDNKSVTLKAKPAAGPGVRFNLSAFAEENDWPPMPAKPSESAKSLNMTGADLSEAIGLVINAAHENQGRIVMNTVAIFRGPEGGLRLIGTDGKWLSMVDLVNVKVPELGAGAVRIPLEAASLVQRFAGRDTAEWWVCITENTLQFEGGGIRVACRPMVGEPPPYDWVINHYSKSSEGIVLLFERKAIQRVVKSASLVIQKRADKAAMTTAITFVLSDNPENIPHKVTVNDPDGGQADIGVSLTWDGPAHSTRYSVLVLPLALATLPDGPVTARLFGVGAKGKDGALLSSPIAIDYMRREGVRHFLVVMPLNGGA